MLKRDITFTDFDGNKQTETHYFNLTKAELVELEIGEMQLAEDGVTVTGKGFVDQLTAVAKSGKGRLIMDTFKDIVFKAYGVRSEDGKSFRKSAELSEEFLCTAAYSELFLELVLNADAAAEFINAIVPTDLAEMVAEREQKAPRADGRPALSDHLPKKQTAKAPASDVVELRTVNEPAQITQGLEAGPSGEEMKVIPSPSQPTGPGTEVPEMSFEAYQRFMARRAEGPKQD